MKSFKNEIDKDIAKWLEDATPEKEMQQEIAEFFSPEVHAAGIKAAWQAYNDPSTDEKTKEALYIALDNMIKEL